MAPGGRSPGSLRFWIGRKADLLNRPAGRPTVMQIADSARAFPSHQTVARRVVTGDLRSLQLRVQLRHGTSEALSPLCGTGFPFNPLLLRRQVGIGTLRHMERTIQR